MPGIFFAIFATPDSENSEGGHLSREFIAHINTELEAIFLIRQFLKSENAGSYHLKIERSQLPIIEVEAHMIGFGQLKEIV